jgi:hypothetical protein
MALEYFNGSSKVTVTKLEMWDGTQKVELRSCSYFDGVTKVPFYSTVAPLSVSKSPAGDINATGTNSTLTSASNTAVISGGVAPYTYLWSVGNQDVGTVQAITPTSSSTIFRIINLPKWAISLNTLNLQVTDSVGQVATLSFNSSWTRTDPDGLPEP